MPKTKVKYRCQHISCRNPKCYEGELELDQDAFELLFEAERDPQQFRSPSGYCNLSNIQVFEILAQELEDEKKLPPRTVLRMLHSRLRETESAKKKIDAQYRKIVEMQKQAEQNIKELKKRIEETSQLTEQE